MLFRSKAVFFALFSVLVLLASPATAQRDYASAYEATLDEKGGHVTSTSLEDTWRLKSFTYEVKKQLKLKFSKGYLVVGQHEGNAMWAVVLPDKAAKISTDMGGGGEKAQHVFVRFHPSRLYDLFPAKTVSGPGSREALSWARVIAAHKVRGKWSSDGNPKLMGEKQIVFDVDVEAGSRRLYEAEWGSSVVKYNGRYVTKALPKSDPIDRKAAAAAFDKTCEVFEANYPLDKVDWADSSWDECKLASKKSCSRAKDTRTVAVAIHALLGRLGDRRIRLKVGDDSLPRYGTAVERTFNVNWDGVTNILGDVKSKDGHWWSKTPNGIGYLSVLNSFDDDAAPKVQETLDELKETWALIVDLRSCARSDGPVEEVAKHFVTEKKVYALRQAGDEEPEAIEIEPGGDWTYKAPIYVLIGEGTAGAGERLALMLKQVDNVQLVGAKTLGGGLFNEWVDVGSDLSVRLPRGRTLDATGNEIDGGLDVDLAIESDPSEYHSGDGDDEDGVDEGDQDPILYKVLELALKTPHDERVTAKDRLE